MKKIDYHIHTPLCKHAFGNPSEYVEKAVAAGFCEIGFADHNPMPDGFDSEHRMEDSQLAPYVASVQRLQQDYAHITIKLGLEADYLPGGESFLAEQLAQYPFDYVYGSVHYIGDWNFDNPVFVHLWENRDVDDTYLRYFDCLEQLIDSGLFDIIAHPDLVKKFGHRPRKIDLQEIYRRICRKLSTAGMCIEINTSGLRKQIGEIYPEKAFLETACEHNVPIVIGSDAHRPEEVGADYTRAVDLARSVGYYQIQRFEGRKKTPVSLDD